MLKSRIVIAAALLLGSALIAVQPASAAGGCGRAPGAARGATVATRPIPAGCRTGRGSSARPTTDARPAPGAARGVTAATRPITAGCPTAHGSDAIGKSARVDSTPLARHGDDGYGYRLDGRQIRGTSTAQ